jgi:DNA-binding NarL/FixJ family response regulator
MSTIRILIADDHPFFRRGLQHLLATAPEMEVVGEVGTGEEAVALAEELQPDVVIMDLKMPGLTGIEATRRIIATSPHIGVLVVTMFEDDHSVFAAMRSGARGYLLKDTDEGEMLRAIEAVGSGEAIFSPGIAQRLLGFFSEVQPSLPPAAFPELTAREREILELIARGYSNSQIVAQLVLSPKTVRNHISNIFSKLQVADRTQAVIRARDAGLGT